MADQAELKGPDFTAGIDVESLQPGDRLLGHVNGEPVLLARIGDDYTAIGATCSHYGGPLADGVIDGESVRCPWHHACFSLRTGEALRAPALTPVPCWKVEREDGRLRVREKVERDPLAATYPMVTRSTNADTAPARIVVIGAGAAGSAATEMLRRCGYKGSITVVDDDTDSPYDRPNLSKDYLAGNAPEEWIPLRPDGFWKEHDVEVVRGHVKRLDAAAKTVHVEAHAPIAYDAALLATGASPVRLDTPGVDLPHVHYLRSLNDSRSLIAAAKQVERAVVIGGSFIGLETAAALRARDIEVDVVAPESLPLEKVLGRDLGEFIKALHEEHGVTFHLGHTAATIEADAVVLDDGTRLDAELVVIGVGVRPRLELAEQAGLALDRGISVNEYLETSAPSVYAAGDIARWPDPYSGDRIRVEHWVVAERQGQTAARNMLGAAEAFGQVPFFWSAHYDVSINYVGHAEKWTGMAVSGKADDKDVAVRYERDGKVLAVATIFRDEESLNAELAMERGEAP